MWDELRSWRSDPEASTAERKERQGGEKERKKKRRGIEK